MNLTLHSIENLKDPFGILTGNRYEIYFNMEVPEDDELYNENGLLIKVLYIVDESGPRVSHYHIYENNTNQLIEFGLEEDEEALLKEMCDKQVEA